MTLPLIIGLPVTGKSTTNAEIAHSLGFKIVNTDHEFRRLRAIPANGNDKDARLMRKFLLQIDIDFPDHPRLAELKAAAKACSDGRAALWDSAYFRSFGEDVFRTFEWVMNQYLHRGGAFKNAVVDLSSSAALYAQNRKLFNPDQGYDVVLLDAPTNLIAHWALKDFRAHQRLSAEAGENKPLRGAYEAFAKAAIKDAGVDNDKVVLGAMTQLSLQHRHERMDAFNGMAQHRVMVEPGQTQADTAGLIVSRLRLG